MPNPTVSVEISSIAARRGAGEVKRSLEALQQGVRALYSDVEKLNTGFRQLGRRPPMDSTTRALRQQATAVQGVTRSMRDQSRISSMLARDQLRASREQSRADAERLRARQRGEQAALTALSTLGEENRALAQRLRFEQRLKMAVDQGVISEQRALQLRERANRVFSTAAVKSRDLRRNMLGLNQSVAMLTARLGPAGIAVNSFTSSMVAAEAASAGFVAAVLGITAILAGLALVEAKAIAKNKEFQFAISELSAITGAMGEDLEYLEERAKEYGRTTTLTASQVAIAFKRVASLKPELLANGPALAEVTRQTILLAEASGLELPVAAESAVNALNQYRAGADQAARFVNVLAAGSKLGAAEIPAIAEALKKAGTVAATAGLSFELTVATLERLAQFGAPAQEYGTAFRNVLLTLQKGADDTNPAIVGLTKALENLAAQELTTAELTQLFGKRSITVAQQMIQTRHSAAELAEAITGTNTAVEQARTRMDNLEGDTRRLSAAWEGFLLAISPTEDTLRGATDALAGFLNLLTDVIEGGQQFGELSFEQLEARIESLQEELQGIRVPTPDVVLQFERLTAERRRRLAGAAADIEDLLGGPLFGVPAAAAGPSGAAGDPAEIGRVSRAYADLEEQLDETLAAERKFARQRDTLTQALEAGLVDQERYNELLKLSRDATLGQSDAERELATQLKHKREEQERAQKAIAKTIADLKIENDGLRRLQEAYKSGSEAVRSVTNELEVEAAVRALGKDATQEQIETIREEIKARQELQKEIGEQRAELAEASKDQGRLAKQTAGAIQKPFENAAENIQREFANTFSDIFRSGIDSFKDFGRRVLDIVTRLAGEIAALLVFRPQVAAGGLGGIFSAIGLGGAAPAGAATGTTGAAASTNPLLSGLGRIGGGLGAGVAGGLAGYQLSGMLGETSTGSRIGGGIGSLVGGAVAAYFSSGNPAAIAAGSFAGNLAGSTIVGVVQDLIKGRNPLGGHDTLQNINRGAFIGGNIGIFGGPLLGMPLTMPIIGTIVGALLGAFGVFEEKKPRGQFLTRAVDTAIEKFEDRVARESPFGLVGLSDWSRKIKRTATERVVDMLLEFDEVIADALSSTQISDVSRALQTTDALGIESAKLGKRLYDLFIDRLNTVFKTVIGGEIGGEYLGQQLQAQLFPLVEDLKRGDESLQTALQRAVQFLQERAAIEKSLDEIIRQSTVGVSEAAQALEALDEQFEALTDQAELYGISLAKVEEAQRLAREALIEGFVAGIEDQILAITDPFELAWQQLERAQEERTRSAQDFGADLVEVERLNLLERERLLEEYARSAKELLQELTAGPTSPLAPRQVLAAAEAQFAELRAAVLGGDLGRLDALVDAARNLLTVSQDVFASSDQFFQRFDFVVRTLQNITEARTLQLPGMQAGGSFRIPATPGIDNVVPLFRADSGETISVTTRTQGAEGAKAAAAQAAASQRILAELASTRRENERQRQALGELLDRSDSNRGEFERRMIARLEALGELIGRQQAAIDRLARSKRSAA